MKRLALIAAFSTFAAVACAAPITPAQVSNGDDGYIVQVRKGGGSSRSAKSGRFVTKSYAGKHKSTTVTHGNTKHGVSAMTRKVYHSVPTKDGWAVKSGGSTVSNHRTQAASEAAAIKAGHQAENKG